MRGLPVLFLKRYAMVDDQTTETDKEGVCNRRCRPPPPGLSLSCVQVLKYCQSELSLRFRQRLTKHVMSKYMEGFTFYAVSNLDDRIANADQVHVA